MKHFLSGVLLEAQALRQYEITPVGGAITLDFGLSNNFVVNLNQNVTSITMSTNVPAGHVQRATVTFVQDATGGRTVAGWPLVVDWLGGNLPAVDGTPEARDTFVFETADSGASYNGFLVASNNLATRRIQALASSNWSTNGVLYLTGTDTAAVTPLTEFARTLLDDNDQATARATLDVPSTGILSQAITDSMVAHLAAADPHGQYLLAAGDTMAGLLTLAGGMSIVGNGQSLLFNYDRSWQFEAADVDAQTRLVLRSLTPSKAFEIQDSDGTVVFRINTNLNSVGGISFLYNPLALDFGGSGAATPAGARVNFDVPRGGPNAVAISDYNSPTESGFYRPTNSSAANLPVVASAQVMLHMQFDANIASQIAKQNSGLGMWVRDKISGSWGPWYQIHHNGTLIVEKGTFLPTFTFGVPGDLSVSYSERLGSYVRIGNLVHFAAYMNFTPTFTTATSFVRIGNLPFSVNSVTSLRAATQISHLTGGGVNTPANFMNWGTRLDHSQNFMYVGYNFNNAGKVGWSLLNDPDITSGSSMAVAVGGTYAI